MKIETDMNEMEMTDEVEMTIDMELNMNADLVLNILMECVETAVNSARRSELIQERRIKFRNRFSPLTKPDILKNTKKLTQPKRKRKDLNKIENSLKLTNFWASAGFLPLKSD